MEDIVTGDGKRIRPDHRGAAAFSPSSRSNWEFPVEKPSQCDRNSWEKGLKLLSSATLTLDARHRLTEWILEPHLQWEWYFDEQSGSLYRHVFDSWHVYKPSPVLTRNRTFQRSTVVPTPPTPLSRATAWLDHLGRAHFEGAASICIPSPPVHSTITTRGQLVSGRPDIIDPGHQEWDGPCGMRWIVYAHY
jgi:hypothetical protein